MKLISTKSLLMIVCFTAINHLMFAQCNINPNAGPDKVNCNAAGAQLQASGGDYYSWAPATGLSNTFQSNPIANPSVQTTYTVTAYHATGNVVTNGNFSLGNTGFTSAYGYVADLPGNNSELQPEGLYGVGTNAANYHSQFQGLDHSTGTGNFMIVNGATISGAAVWQQTVSVVAGQQYFFGCWISAIHPTNLAQLVFTINGQTISASPTISPILPIGTWTQFYTSWNSGASTSAIIKIENINTNFNGNDFGLDDITFTTTCSATDMVVVTPSNIGATFTSVLPKCITNGSIDITLTQGSVATSYLWNTNATTQDLANAAAGTYHVTITNAQGCNAVKEIILPVPTPVELSSVATNVACNGGNNGSIDLSVSGVSPYTYIWSNSKTTQDINTLTANTYTVTVTAANQCTATKVTTVTQPTAITVSGVIVPTSTCVAPCNGSITQTVGGGISPYTYVWTPTATTKNLSAICEGTYTVIVKDANLCTTNKVYIVGNLCTPPPVVPCNAVQVISFTQMKRKDGTNVAPNRSNPSQALGVPQNVDGYNYVALGFGGSITLKLDNVVYNHAGPDLVITETTFTNPTCNTNPESAKIEVSMDNITYFNLGNVCQDGLVDMGTVFSAQYVRITDVSNPASFVGSSDGYDVDGVMCYVPAQRYEDNINTPDNETLLAVYPNPVSDIMTLTMTAEGNSVIHIHDYVGKEIYTEKFDADNNMNGEMKIDISNFVSGIYMVTLESGSATQTIKVIKK